MTVLLVDDQIRILSGLISGLDWDALEVSSIRTATNAAQAKIILQEEHVDILLCDIEMPGETASPCCAGPGTATWTLSACSSPPTRTSSTPRRPSS